LCEVLIQRSQSPVQSSPSNEAWLQLVDRDALEQQQVGECERVEYEEGKPFVYVSALHSYSSFWLIKTTKSAGLSLQYAIKDCRIPPSIGPSQSLRPPPPPLTSTDSDCSLSDISSLSPFSLGSSSSANTSFCSDISTQETHPFKTSSPSTGPTNDEIDHVLQDLDDDRQPMFSSLPPKDSFSDDASFVTDEIIDEDDHWDSLCDGELSLDPYDPDPQPGVRECGTYLTPIPEHATLDKFEFD
jgi:hypothetical protein